MYFDTDGFFWTSQTDEFLKSLAIGFRRCEVEKLLTQTPAW